MKKVFELAVFALACSAGAGLVMWVAGNFEPERFFAAVWYLTFGYAVGRWFQISL